ncbi:MAG TPA: cytochrome c biogenesis protein CcsA [Chitinophagaceae bacterium]
MDFTGEHLLPGFLGHFFITLSVVASLVATVAYFKTTQSKIESETNSWKRLARGAFVIEAASVFSIFAILFYIIYNHFFEYKYAWQHSSRSLEVKYLLSCFWEGQEGSFLLWSIWHSVLGLILIRKAKKWEAPVMTIVSFAQVCLATMIAGVYFFNSRIGSSPFVLMRDEFDLKSQIPMLTVGNNYKDYLRFITDGNDLNPLLQNYWMVIHPPVLFLGFASTLIPFSFAMAGLWTKKFGDWTKAALPWALFSAAVLGTGIMMGGRWAYESLSFGGYWAWDPVENASLVPWLTLIAGIHTLLIYKHTGHSLRATHFFFLITFGLVLYSTFLTRTGVLGDTSVHAFTGEGNSLYYHLQIMMAVMLIPAFLTFALNYKKIPTIAKEEQTSSREFWMFIGSLIFFLSAMFIIIATSLPVINNIIPYIPVLKNYVKDKLSMGEDSVFAYNRVIIFVAIIIGILTTVIQYLKYKQTNSKFFWKKFMWPAFIALAIATLVLAFGNINYIEHGGGFLAAIWFALVCGIYAVVANTAYIWLGMKGKLKLSGGSISHLGFGLMLVGILISSSKKEVLSYNTSGIFVPLDEKSKITGQAGENLTLVKGVPTTMGNYDVTYESDSEHPKKDLWYYKLHFTSKTGNEEFTLVPNAFVNYKNNQGLMANPAAKHYWNHDIFTYITSLPDPKKNKDTASFRPYAKSLHDTIFYSNGYVTVDTIIVNPPGAKYHLNNTDTALMAGLTVHSKDGPSYQARPAIRLNGRNSDYVLDTIPSQNLIIAFTGFEGPQKLKLQVKESNSLMEYITLKAYDFPFINLLWAGVIIMVIGIIISIVRRVQLNKSDRALENLTL